MASIIAQASGVAHKTIATLLSATQVTVGKVRPGSSLSSNFKVGVKEVAPDATLTFESENLTGKTIIVGVPGAFTGTCNQHVPGFIKLFDKFVEKGVKNIFIVSVNDVFVVKAWKENLAPSGTGVRFIADDTGAFVGSLGLIFDASDRLGGPRSQRFVIVAEGGVITQLAVEPVAGEVTVTAADKILALL